MSGMSEFVGLASVKLADRRILITPNLSDGWHRTVVSEKTNVDGGSTPNTLLRPGNVLLYDAATGKYFDDAVGGDASTPAVVDGTATANWASKVVTLIIDGQTIIAVTLAAGDDTAAEIVTALNANATFRAHAIASNPAGATVRVTSLRVGAEVHMKLTGDHADVFGGAAGTEARGTDGDFVVTVEFANQLNPVGVSADAKVHVVGRGHFDESNLINLTADAKRVLLRRGSRFES